jgi:YegS/Rv2252/BmrU family lipid kinase
LKWLAIINPTSGGGRTLGRWKSQIKPILGKFNIKYDEAFTKHPKHAIELTHKEIENYDGVLAIGGDGTTNEVLNGILSSSTPDKIFGIIPTGTGNDIANTCQVHLDITKACLILVPGKNIIKKIDIGVVKGRNFEGKNIERYFAGVASFGFDAEVGYDTNKRSKRFPGTINYIISVFKTLITVKDRLFKISLIEGNETTQIINEQAFLLAVGNGKSYGGGMLICPDADIYDGRFHGTILKKVSKIEFTKVFPSVYKGEHVTHPAIRLFEGPELLVQTNKRTLYQVDGEILGYTPVKVTTLPKKLNVLIPKNS